ncbi:MAG: hypothetical protein QOD36_1362, partial [Mycobacterium sp.]|nr:hypothetical protein [Mycobacterium sp.]
KLAQIDKHGHGPAAVNLGIPTSTHRPHGHAMAANPC